jgi:hypothetical protein
VVVESKQYATVNEAEENVYLIASGLALEDFSEHQHLNGGRLAVTPKLLETHAYRRRHVQEIVRTSGASTFRVVKLYQQVELSPNLRSRLYELWRAETVERRLWGLGSLVAFLTLITGTIATYLRLNLRTHGAYRGRLKFACVCLITAAGMVLATLA